MRLCALGMILLLVPAGVVYSSRVDVPGDSLAVHEWGTFTSVAGRDGLPVEWSPLAGPSNLPCFVYRFPLSKGLMSGTVRMETPVIYFYAPREMTVSTKVRFPRGLISEWYPRASAMSPTEQTRQAQAGSWIEWRDVRVSPGLRADLITQSANSHYYLARRTGAAPIQTGGQTEKFLFYRGVGRFPIPISAALIADGKLAIRNLDTSVIPNAVVFENRAGRVAYRVLGPVNRDVTVDRPAGEGSVADLKLELERILVAAGLFIKEAQAMVDTWTDSWFEDGSRIFYIVPGKTVDSILPLDIQPPPAALARVFVGRVELITSEIEQEVEQAIRENDKAAIERRGRFLQPILANLAANNGGRIRSAVVDRVLGEGVNTWSSCR